MTAEQLAEQLQKKAITALLNPDEVSEQLAAIAAAEALELTENKEIAEAMLLDLAIFRLKLWLKVGLDEHDKQLADAAIKAAKEKDVVSGEPKTCIVKTRVSEW